MVTYCRITDSSGKEQFMLRVLHTVDLHLSVLQLYHKGNLVAMAHVIGHEQLVAPDQVSVTGVLGHTCVTVC